MKMSSHLKAELAATFSTLGRLHKGEYLIEPDCIESVKDLIRYLKRDNGSHEIRRFLGESKVLQNDLIHIVKSCPEEDSDLFDVTLRLLINLTTPAMLFFGEDIPTDKIARNIYLSLIGYSQDYKIAFCDIEFWNKICGKLTNLFETDWTERSADDGIQIERMLMLLRNVLQVPADEESEKRPENDITVHDKVLWALRQSQILELLLFVSSNRNEEQYYLNLLEIFSLILREHNPKLLAQCNIKRSDAEKNKDTEDLIKVRESEKKNRNKYLNLRNFNATFVMKGVKSLSQKDVVSHKSLDKVNSLDLISLSKKPIRIRRNRVPIESERLERRSSFSVRLFLKEFCLEFLNSSFKHLMSVVKNKLESGKSLANDQTYYFWSLKFFLDFAVSTNSDVDLIRDFLSSESFHFVQTNMDNAFEHLSADKKKTTEWVKRIHLILKAYHSLLETLLWMDCSKNPLTRSISREIKSQIFYVVEYREMTLHVLLKYDPAKFSVSYLRDLIETTHLFIKLLEDYSKQTKLVVQKITRRKSSRKNSKKAEAAVETREEKWEKIKDDVYDTLCNESVFPEIPPFDAALEIAIDDQKGRAMKKIQKFLHEGKIRDAIGFLRSARQVWPENDFFGAEGISVEDETMALQEICLADLGEVEGDDGKDTYDSEEIDERESEGLEDESRMEIVEHDFDMMDYKKRLSNKKVVEGCGILLKDYEKNSNHTNHCVIKLLHRIGWECCMPGMLFQASIFWTLLKVMQDNSENYNEIKTFAVNLFRKFRKHAEKNPIIFLELLFWKDHDVALEIQHGYQPYEEKQIPGKQSKSNKCEGQMDNDEEGVSKRKRKRKKKKQLTDNLNFDGLGEDNENSTSKNKKGKKVRKRKTKKGTEKSDYSENKSESFAGDEDCVEFRVPKSVDSVSRNLFDNSDSDVESNVVNEGHNLKRKEREYSHENTESLNESEGLKRQVAETEKTRVKYKASRRRVIDSSDEENEVDDRNQPSEKFSKNNEGSSKSVENQSEHGRTFTVSSDHEEGYETLNTQTSGSATVENVMSASNRLKLLDDGISEDEGIQEFDKKKAGSGQENPEQCDSSQKSNTWSKKGRENKVEGDSSSGDSDIESDNSKSKRPRCISSDSDVENFESDEEKPVSLNNRKRRRLAIVDSDSEVDTNSLDGK